MAEHRPARAMRFGIVALLGVGSVPSKDGGVIEWLGDGVCPASLRLQWDSATLVSFSTYQLDAVARIAAGGCPLLSRSINCVAPGESQAPRPRTTVQNFMVLRAYLAEEAELSRRIVVSMMRHVWRNYELHAWGKDELRPVSGKGVDTWGGLGQTLVDALDTLHMMGLHSEFNRAADWAEVNLDLDKDLNVNVFETSIRLLGGLLSAYALSGREALLAKAEELGSRLFPAFGAVESNLGSGPLEEDLGPHIDKPTPQQVLPFSDVNLRTGEVRNLAGFVSLAEAFTPLEWKSLARFTRNCSYATPVDRVLELLNRTASLHKYGLGPIMLTKDGSFFPSSQNRLSLGSRGDSFYEYLLKDSLFVGASDDTPSQQLWDAFLQGLNTVLVAAPQSGETWSRSGEFPTRQLPKLQELGGWYEDARDVDHWIFIKEITSDQTIPKIDHLVCFLPGSLALDVYHKYQPSAGAEALNTSALPPEGKRQLLLAHKLMQTCVQMYFRTTSGLAPEITRFGGGGLVDDSGSMHSLLRPETIESLVMLWRATKRQIYRNWGQRILSAFGRARSRYGFASLEDVNIPSTRRDEMPSFFLAETLKYFFLLFADDEALHLRDAVLNTEAHPLPSAGASWACAGADFKAATAGKLPRKPKVISEGVLGVGAVSDLATNLVVPAWYIAGEAWQPDLTELEWSIVVYLPVVVITCVSAWLGYDARKRSWRIGQSSLARRRGDVQENSDASGTEASERTI